MKFKIFSFLFFLLLFISGCGYTFKNLSRKSISIVSVKSEISELSGIEPFISEELIKGLTERGIRLVKKCPFLSVDLVSLSATDFFYNKEGYLTYIKGSAHYKVDIIYCNGKKKTRVFPIPISYWYYSSPYATNASKRKNVIKSVEELSEKILSIL